MEAPEVKVPGLQLSDIKTGGGTTAEVIVPPVAVIGSVPPEGRAPKAFIMPIEAAVTPGTIVAVTFATGIVPMELALRSPGVNPVK